MAESVSLDLSKPPPNRDYTNRPDPGPIFDIEVELIGIDGNALTLMGRVRRALMKEGLVKEADYFVEQGFKTKSYEELLRLIHRTVIVT